MLDNGEGAYPIGNCLIYRNLILMNVILEPCTISIKVSSRKVIFYHFYQNTPKIWYDYFDVVDDTKKFLICLKE
jgi:hypothetical protein